MASQSRVQEPLAVVGISYRFPGSKSNDHKLWELMESGKNTWGKLPANRYNSDAYYHPDPNHAGSIVAGGGYFMTDDPAAFDAPFFGIGAAEATALDPQHRFLLECTYECLESAGIPMEKVKGSKTGCFAGAFLKDYDLLTSCDMMNVPMYSAVGGSANFLSNRVSWFFDLTGPSLTLDTACSSSLVAFHLACQSVWSGECDQALAAGASMILVPHAARALTQMQFLSPDGRCYSFDERANGYARGEGIATLMIKPIRAAIRDGDCIRALIRASAVNQNGRTPGITMPSTEAQAALIRTAYASAGLDLDTTGYFEAHGTGTPIGDPMEFNAIAQTLVNETRTSPLIVGSIKANLGHLEGTAGLAGLIKAILTVEKGVITPLAGFGKPNPKLRLDNPNLQLATKLQDWPCSGIRRASVNSFGAGGSNAHVVIDDAVSYLQMHGLKGNHRTATVPSSPFTDSGIGSSDSSDEDVDILGKTTGSPRIYVFSSPEQAGLKRMTDSYAQYLKDKIEVSTHDKADDILKSTSVDKKLDLDQLAQTLCSHRSQFDWKTFTIASSMTELQSNLEKGLPKLEKETKTAGIAFIFSGQGVQSPRMGLDLLQYPVYRQHLNEADAYLKTLGSSWSALEELKRDEASSRIDDARYAQPLSIILQTGLVDLLKSWGVNAKFVVGHSSGEIAAAYACGALSKEHAWKVAYYRGYFSSSISEMYPNTTGGMLAVGLGEAEMTEYLKKFDNSDVVIACVNSPHSTTLSGPKDSIGIIAEHFNKDKIFQSKLRVKNAYHSPAMKVVSEDYRKSIEDIKPCGSSSAVMFSSVTGARIDPSTLDAQYWVDNMLNKVKFTAAVESILFATTKSKSRRKTKFDLDTFLEIGPHSALQTPLKQIVELAGEKEQAQLGYKSVLQRGKNAAETTLRAVSQLWARGHAVNLAKANQVGKVSQARGPIADLPPYPWNRHAKNRYWNKSLTPLSRLHPPRARNDFLGMLEDDNKTTPQYRNFLKLEENPWISEHEIQGTIFLPATSFVVMAIEAAMDGLEEGKVASRIELRDVVVQRPLIFLDRSKSIETRVSLTPHKIGTRLGGAPWTQVTIYSRSPTDDSWIEHSSCYFMVHYKTTTSDVEGVSEESREAKACQETWLDFQSRATVKNSVATIYTTLSNCGFKYGPLFRNLKQLYSGNAVATGVIEIPDTKAAMPKSYESPHVVHPITLDNALQLINATLRYSGLKQTTMLPTSMGSVIVDLDVTKITSQAGAELKGYASYERSGFHEIVAQIVVSEGNFDKPLITVKNLFCQEVAGIMDLAPENGAQIKPIATELMWREDVELLSPKALESVLACSAETAQKMLTTDSKHSSAADDGDVSHQHSSQSSEHANTELLSYMTELVKLQGFKNPSLTVLEVDCLGPKVATTIIDRLSDARQTPQIDRYVMTGAVSKPAWATDLQKKTAVAVEYNQFEFSGTSEECPIEAGSVDSIVSANAPGDFNALALLAKQAQELLKPQGKLSLILPKQGSAAVRHELDLILRQAGFNGINVLLESKSGSDTDLFLTATKSANIEIDTNTEILFIEPSQHDSRILALMRNLEESLSSTGRKVSRATVESLPDTRGKAIISFQGLGASSLNDMSASEFSAWRDMVLKHAGLLWISSGAVEPTKNPLSAMATGALRAVRSEESQLRIVQLDLSDELDLHSEAASSLVLDVLNTQLFAPADNVVEMEFNERGGNLFIPRLFTLHAANDAIHYVTQDPAPHKQKLRESSEVLQLAIGTAGMLDSLHFAAPKDFPKELPECSVKVKVTATPINFVDIMVAMGLVPASSLGCECAGTVVEAHEGGRFKVGDEVVVLTGKSFATHVVEKESFVQAIPKGMTAAAAASCPIVYVTAYVALMDVARIQKGESVLIHAGAGGLGQAAIQLCRMVGAEIFVTVGSVAKKNLLMDKYGIGEDHIFNSRDLTFAKGVMRQTKQRGVDVILNSTNGEALRQTWYCIAPFGRFLEVGKRDIIMNTGLDMTPFLRNVGYFGVHIDQMVGPERRKVSEAMQKVFDLLNEGKIGEVHPVTVMTYTDMERGFRMVQAGKHTGKVVLTASNDDVVSVIGNPLDPLVLKPDVTYAIAGGLGGIGQSVVDQMFDCGARHFAFFSRSGDARPEARKYLDNLERRGGHARAFKADISKYESLSAAIEQMNREMPPVKGFINSAMDLQDCLLSKMSYEEWIKSLAPKVDGSWNFHQLLPDGLDFFVTLSSISAMIGVPGQSNYDSACAYQDALCHYRQSIGQKARSVQLSGVFGVGVLEESKESLSSYYDLISINEVEMNALLGFGMKSTTLKGVTSPMVITTGVNPSMLNVSGLQWCLDPKFRMLKKNGEERGASTSEDAKSKLLEELAECTSLLAASKAIETHVIARLASSMMCNTEDVNTSKPLHSFGVDSLVAVEMRNWTFKELKSEITVFDIMAPQPLTALCLVIAEKSKLVSAEIKAQAKEEE